MNLLRIRNSRYHLFQIDTCHTYAQYAAFRGWLAYCLVRIWYRIRKGAWLNHIDLTHTIHGTGIFSDIWLEVGLALLLSVLAKFGPIPMIEVLKTFVSKSRSIFCPEIRPEIFGPMFRKHIAESKFQMKDLDSSDRMTNLTTLRTFGCWTFRIRPQLNASSPEWIANLRHFPNIFPMEM